MKKFIVLLSLVFVLFGFNFVFAEEISEVITCTESQDLVDGVCIDKVVESLICEDPQIPNDAGDACVDPIPEVNPIIEPTPDPVNIHLKIISGTDSLYDNDISVTACDSDKKLETPDTITAYCAVLQSGLESDWSWYGDGAFVNSVGGISSDSANFKYWTWLANLDFNNFHLAANQYELKSNDKILFYFDTNPLIISTNNLTPVIGSDIVVSISEPDYGPWPPVWVPSINSQIIIGLESFDVDESGEYKINISNTDPFSIFGQKDGYIDSPSITINPIASDQEEDMCTNGATNPPICDNNTSGNGGGSSGDDEEEKKFSVPNAISFLSSQQQSDGSFGDLLYTDWVAISAKAGNDSSLQSSIKNYLLNNPVSSSVITDYERHAMALMALGVNPYNGTEVNYIQKILDSFDGTQLKDSLSDYEDDIFGLIVLQNASYDEEDEIINKIISYVISKQSGNGSWGSVDMTSAGIMALDEFDNVEGVEDAISKAENYIIGEQKSDGSFGNSFSTSWTIQALSLNSSLDDAVNNAIKYLAENQENDGGMEKIDSNINNRIWATSYAIPAVLKLSWNDILEDFDKYVVSNDSLPVSIENISASNVSENIIIEPVIINQVFCPEGDLFSTKTGEPCTAIEEINTENNNSIMQIQKIENSVVKKEVKIDKIVEPQILQEEVSQIENNLSASAGNLKNFPNNKIIILTIISVLIISIGGWLMNKYIKK